MMRERLGTNALPILLPIGKEDTFVGVVDIITRKADIYKDDMGKEIEVTDVPADMVDLVEEYREKIVELAAEQDDALMEKYFEEGDLSIEEIKVGLRKATLAMKVTPVLCGSSYKNKGVQNLLDAITDYLPSPLDVGTTFGSNPNTDAEEKR
jgi:elongation factor G